MKSDRKKSGLEGVGKIVRAFLCACCLTCVIGGAARADGPAPERVDVMTERVRRAVEPVPQNTDIADAAQRHIEISEEFGIRSGLTDACTLAQSAQALVPLLAASLESEHGVLASRGVDSDSAAALDAFERRIEHADTDLVGIGLRVGAEAVHVYVRYDEIADAGIGENDAAMFFRAVAQLWDGATGWPVYIEQQTDVTGCHDPGALIAPMEGLGRVWDRAPECARSLVLDVVRQSVRSALSSASCYCHARGKAAADAARLAELADDLGFGVPAPEIDALWTHLQRDEVRFACVAN